MSAAKEFREGIGAAKAPADRKKPGPYYKDGILAGVSESHQSDKRERPEIPLVKEKAS